MQWFHVNVELLHFHKPDVYVYDYISDLFCYSPLRMFIICKDEQQNNCEQQQEAQTLTLIYFYTKLVHLYTVYSKKGKFL